MKKMKYLRSWLTIALVVTIIGSLTGGTVAWFTDNVESTNNVIQSGTLDIDIELKDGVNWISLEKEPETKIFEYDLWEPGYTQVETMKIVNRGNLALEYILNVQTTDADEFTFEGETLTLANAIDVYMAFGEKTPTSFSDISEANGWWKAGNLAAMMADTENGFTKGAMLPSNKTEAPDGLLETGLMQGECTCTIALHMKEEAGNEYQNRSLGNIGFILKAKQYMYEEDSFNNEYDKEALYGEGSIVNNMPYAKVRELEGDELTIVTDNMGYTDFQGLTLLDGEKVLDRGLVFTALDTPEDIAGKDYADWSVDFEITSSIPLSADDTTPRIAMAGQYTAWLDEWVGFEVSNLDIPANEPQRVMQVFTRMKYAEIVETVKEFQCGVIILDDEYFAGHTLKLDLCVYETDGHGNEIEGGKHVIKSFTFGF